MRHWASQAVTWLTNRQPAKDFAACERDIKSGVNNTGEIRCEKTKFLP
jgi:hypothetical protein